MYPIYLNNELVGVCISADVAVVVQRGLDKGLVAPNDIVNVDGYFPGDGSVTLPDNMVFENMLNEEMELAPVAICKNALRVAYILNEKNKEGWDG